MKQGLEGQRGIKGNTKEMRGTYLLTEQKWSFLEYEKQVLFRNKELEVRIRIRANVTEKYPLSHYN